MPATPADAKGLLKSAIRDDDPVIFIEHKLLYLTDGDVPDEDYVTPLGKADIVRAGTDVTLVAWSHMATKATTAAEQLAEEGISVEVIDLRSIVPMDVEAVLGLGAPHGPLVIAQEAIQRGGVASDVAARSWRNMASPICALPIIRVAGLNTVIPFNLALERATVPQVEDVVRASGQSWARRLRPATERGRGTAGGSMRPLIGSQLEDAPDAGRGRLVPGDAGPTGHRRRGSRSVRPAGVPVPVRRPGSADRDQRGVGCAGCPSRGRRPVHRRCVSADAGRSRRAVRRGRPPGAPAISRGDPGSGGGQDRGSAALADGARGVRRGRAEPAPMRQPPRSRASSTACWA